MIWALFGTLLGIIVGLSIQYTIPTFLIKYIAVMIIGMLDAIFGGLKGEVTKEEYDPKIFITGLVFNVILALGITLLGERLGLDLYLAVTVVFIFRIFSNLGVTRRALLEKLLKKKSSK
ncbi:MAG: small basic family protein [Patescibacteria group bacterium]